MDAQRDFAGASGAADDGSSNLVFSVGTEEVGDYNDNIPTPSLPSGEDVDDDGVEVKLESVGGTGGTRFRNRIPRKAPQVHYSARGRAPHRGGRTFGRGRGGARGRGRGGLSPGRPKLFSTPRMRDQDDFNEWKIGVGGLVDLSTVTTFGNPAGLWPKVGFNQLAPNYACPYPSCGDPPCSIKPEVRLKPTMKEGDRCRVRVFAAFHNMRGCSVHQEALWNAVGELAKGWSSDEIRPFWMKNATLLTREEALTFRPLLVGLLEQWHRTPIIYGSWMHEAVRLMRLTMTSYALRLNASYGLIVQDRLISPRAQIDELIWEKTLRGLQRAARTSSSNVTGPSQGVVGRAPSLSPSPSSRSLAQHQPSSSSSSSSSPSAASSSVSSAGRKRMVLTWEDDEWKEKEEEVKERTVMKKVRKLVDSPLSSNSKGLVVKGAPSAAARPSPQHSLSSRLPKPTVALVPGQPALVLQPFTGDMLSCPMDFTTLAALTWPAFTGVPFGALRELSPEDRVRHSGYWRGEDECRHHRGAAPHVCWDFRDVRAAARLAGKEEPQGVPSLDLLQQLEHTMTQCWSECALYVSELVLLLETHTEEKLPKEAFTQDHKRLHEKYWPPKYEVKDLPSDHAMGLEDWRTELPEPLMVGRLGEYYKVVLLQDFPAGRLLPDHISRWLVKRVPQFKGLNPSLLSCFRNKEGLPDLDYTRALVARHRFQVLLEILGEIAAGGRLKIPLARIAYLEETAKEWKFAGENLKGANQIILSHLDIRNARNQIDMELAETCKLLTAEALFAFTKAGRNLCETYNNFQAEGTLISSLTYFVR